MRLRRRSAVLILVAALGGGALWDGSQRQPLPPASGSGLGGHAPGIAPLDRRLTVVQFNIHRGRGAAGDEDLAATARCLEGAEIAGLNEVGGGEWLGSEADQAQILGEQLGLAYLFLPSERRWWHPHFGNALLSALPASRWQRQPLPGGTGGGRRALGIVELPWQDTTLTLVTTHLDRGADRQAQLALVAERFAALPAPKILLGDLNSGPDEAVIAAWRADPTLLVTSGEAAGAAPSGVDWIVAAGFRLTRSWRCDQGASDHPAVGAELERAF